MLEGKTVINVNRPGPTSLVGLSQWLGCQPRHPETRKRESESTKLWEDICVLILRNKMAFAG